MAFPFAAVAAPAIGNFLGGLFGGSGPDRGKIYDQQFRSLMGSLPQFDQRGLEERAAQDVARNTRQRVLQTQQQLGQAGLGRSVSGAFAPAAFNLQGLEQLGRARQDIRGQAAQFGLARTGLAGQLAGQRAGLEKGPGTLRQSLGGLFAGLGQGAGNYFQGQADLGGLLDMLKNPQIREFLGMSSPTGTTAYRQITTDPLYG